MFTRPRWRGRQTPGVTPARSLLRGRAAAAQRWLTGTPATNVTAVSRDRSEGTIKPAVIWDPLSSVHRNAHS